MIRKIASVISILTLVIGCTQFLEEDNVAETNYTGDDGCIYCHTNSDRLKALAEEEEEIHTGGGG